MKNEHQKAHIKKYFQQLPDWLHSIQDVDSVVPRIILSVVLFLLIIMVFGLNLYVGKYFNVFVFNLFPVVMAAWWIGLEMGVIFAISCSLLGFASDFLIKPEVGLPLTVITTLIRIIVLSLIAYGSWKIQDMMQRLLVFGLTDILTDMNNRRGFFMQGQLELERVSRAKRPISFVYIDLDDFKTVNDSKGHDSGDEVLQYVANIIKSRLRKSDVSARLGGDEFAIVLPFTDKEGALKLGNELQRCINESLANHQIPITISIGIATFMQAPESLDYALKCADSVMYEIKNSTKNAMLQRNFLPTSRADEHATH